MYTKLKLYISQEMKDRLLYEADLFEFHKKDDSINLNSFLKTVIINYYTLYINHKKNLEAEIRSIVRSHCSINETKLQSMIRDIARITEIDEDISGNSKSTLSVTLDDKSDNALNVLMHETYAYSKSGCLRNLIYSYFTLPRTEREKIIFASVLDSINEAIDEHSLLTFTTTVSNNKFTVIPYSVASSKIELFNYLIGYEPDYDRVRTFRISRIRYPYVKHEPASFPQDIIYKMQFAKDNAPQFAFDDLVKGYVHLTEHGEFLYKKIITNRPKLEKLSDGEYAFEWDAFAITEYFQRFGADAVITEPKCLHAKVSEFFERATAAYK